MGRAQSQLSLDELRARAEAVLAPHSSWSSALERELELYQLELEMQNSELIRVGDELSSALDRWRRLVHAAPVALLHCDGDGVIADANQAALDLVGSGLAGKPLVSLVVPDDVRICTLWVRRWGESSTPIRVLLRAASGETVAVEASAASVAGGPEVSVSLVPTVATKPAALELDDVLSAIPLASLVIDGDQIAFANTKAADLFGYESLRGIRITALLPGWASWLAAADGQPERSRPGAEGEPYGMRRDGRRFWVELSTHSIVQGGETLAMVTILDTSARREAEMVGRQAQRIDLLGHLATSMAHEFNNMLMGIRGCADVALECLDGDSSAQFYVDEIRRTVASGSAIARQLLAFSRRREPSPQVFEPKRLVIGMRAVLDRLLGAQIELRLELQDDVPPVHCDPWHLEQVLMNLAVNARDALERGGGELRIAVESVVLGERNDAGLPEGTYVAITVADTGVGMSPQVLARAFEPFFTTKKLGKGTGLGLPTVRDIIEQSGGGVCLDSEPGRGTTVRLILPRSEGTPTMRLPSEEPVKAEHGSETVLLVEDDAAVSMVIRHYLRRAGYRVLDAESGDEAVRCCENFPEAVDLLLTDMVLPGMTGDEVARRVRELRPNIRVLHMSAHDPEWLKSQGWLPQTASILAKPFSAAVLLDRVRAVLDRE